jgi:hypothetical protein
MKITNNFKWYLQCKVLVATRFLSIPNGHMPLSGEWITTYLLVGQQNLYATKLDLL